MSGRQLAGKDGFADRVVNTAAARFAFNLFEYDGDNYILPVLLVT
jgi:hypothetical protein